MSEKSPSPDKSVDKDKSRDFYHIEGAPDALQLEAIEKLREAQSQYEEMEVEKASPYDLVERSERRRDARKSFESMIKTHLQKYGIEADDEKFDEYASTLRNSSVDRISPEEWMMGKPGSDDDESLGPRRLVVLDELKKKYESKTSGDDEDTEEASDDDGEKTDTDADDKPEEKDDASEKAKDRKERIEELEKEIEALRGAKHASFAKRMAVSYFRFKKKKAAQEEYEDSEAAYLKKVAELEQLKMDIDTEEHHESYSRDEDVKKLLAERVSERLKEDNDLQHEAMLKEGGFKARLLEKWANMSKKKKIAAAIGLGAVTAAGGFGVALLGGAIGTVGGLLLAGGWTSAKGVKTKAMAYSRMYKKKDPETLKVAFSNDTIEPSLALKEAIARLRGEAKKDIESGDKVKRNAVLLALGGAALGSTAALGLSHGFDWVTDRPASGWTGGWVGDQIAGPENTPTPQWSLPHGIEDVATNKPEVNVTDFNIRPGAGWYEEFSKIPGIPKEHYHELLQKVGPQLHEIKDSAGHPIAYEMHGHPGEWGVRMTPDGKMPEEAFQKVQDAYNEMQGANAGSVAHEAASQATAPADVDHVNLTNTDVNDLSSVIHMDTITPEAVEAHQSLLDKIGYTANGVSAEKLADRIGIPDRVWLDNLKPFLVDHVQDHMRIDGYDYSDYFSVQNGDVVFATNNKLPSAIVADILRQVPENVRESATIS